MGTPLLVKYTKNCATTNYFFNHQLICNMFLAISIKKNWIALCTNSWPKSTLAAEVNVGIAPTTESNTVYFSNYNATRYSIITNKIKVARTNIASSSRNRSNSVEWWKRPLCSFDITVIRWTVTVVRETYRHYIKL